mmetsp:Transcript_54394/g.122215  ORF Transcript_54394/g.122215 Transcript_54394/m.122215 type:complete len:87 (-) Transcript_54394:48-308(-)
MSFTLNTWLKAGVSTQAWTAGLFHQLHLLLSGRGTGGAPRVGCIALAGVLSAAAAKHKSRMSWMLLRKQSIHDERSQGQLASATAW